MPDHIPEEAKNFKLLGHDPSAAWGGGSIVEINQGFAYVGAVGSASYNGPEGFTVHDVRDPRKPRKVAEVKSPPGVHSHKLRVVDGDHRAQHPRFALSGLHPVALPLVAPLEFIEALAQLGLARYRVHTHGLEASEVAARPDNGKRDECHHAEEWCERRDSNWRVCRFRHFRST